MFGFASHTRVPHRDGYGYDLNYTTGQYTMLGQRVSMTATVPSQGLSNHQTNYEYDPSYQLLKATYPNVAPFNGEIDSWTYDAIGNRLTNTVNGSTQTYSYQKIGANPNNWQRLTNDGSNAYTYSGNGSTVTRNGPGGNFTFGYNYDNRMVSISGAAAASYLYDYQGRRSTKTVGTATTYLYDGLNLVREAGASSADYLFGPGIDEPLAMSRGGQLYYYGVDGLGSVATLTNSSATVQNSYLYDAWGQTRTQTGTLANPFTYTSREAGEAGLSFYRARYLQPAIGRFLQEDPDGMRWGINLFRYANDNPLQFRDPSGLKACKSGRCPDCPDGTWVSTAGTAEGGIHIGPVEVGGVVFAGVFVCLSNPTFNVPWVTFCAFGSAGKEKKPPSVNAAVTKGWGFAGGVGAAGVTCFGYPCREDLAGGEGGGFAQAGPVFGFVEGNVFSGRGCVGAGAAAGMGLFGGGFGCRTYIRE